MKFVSVKKKATITIPFDKAKVKKKFKVTVKTKGKVSKKFTAKSNKKSVATVKVSGKKIIVTAKKAADDASAAWKALVKKADKNGFIIKNKVLIRYVGSKKTVKIPKKVKAIAGGAFEVVEGYPAKTRTVIIPGTCKTIRAEAFVFSGLKKIVMKKGVRKLGKRCFADTYLKKIYFPKTVKKIGKQIMETEEGLQGTKIYVYKCSKAAKYFKKAKNKPYGRYKIKYRK